MIRNSLGALMLIAGIARAQTLAFDVATIKPSSEVPSVRVAAPGRLSLGGLTLQGLIRFAYGSDFGNVTVSGGPKWIDESSSRFDVEGQGPPTATPTDLKQMLRTLLLERFSLKVHTESKEVAGYALVLERRDGKLGPNIVDVTGKPCEGVTPPPDLNRSRCGDSISPSTGAKLRGARVAHFADLLSNQVFNLGRQVIDRTGLTGEFDITLNYEIARNVGGRLVTGELASEGPSLASALKEQLGFKLDSIRVSAETLFVDSAEKPGEN